jgi:N-acetylneuraminic acid mutarotase
MHPRPGLAAVIGLILFVVFLLSGSPQTPAPAQAGAPARAASHAPLDGLVSRAPLTTTTPVMTTPTSTATATPLPCQVGEWNLRAPYPTAIAGAAGVAQDGILYNFGGALPTTVLSDSYKYTPATNTWAAIAPLPAPRLVAGAVSDGTYIYILGGTTGQGATNTFWRYDPVQDSYLSLASSPVSVNSPAVAYLNGKIYRIGGCTAGNGSCTGDEIDTVDIYTIATDTWAPAAPYPLARSSIAVTALNGYIYTAGGVTQSPWFTGSPKTYRYDPASNTWDDTAIADLPGSITDVVSGMLNGRWILAGAGHFGSFAGAWDPGADTWTLLPSPPLAHDFASGGSTGQALYVVGGLDPNDTWQADTQAYQEPACPPTPTVTGTPPTATATPTASSTATATQTPLPCGVGAWTLRTPYPTAVAGAAGVIQDGILYNFGGTGTDGVEILNAAYKYNPGVDTWTPLAPIPAPRVVASAVSDGTYIYILGGWGTQGATNTFWRYDPAQNTYAALAPATLNVGGAALVYLNGKIYRIGGCTVRNGDCSGGQTDTVDVYTIATDTWVPAASYPLIRGHISATVLNGYIYTAGGVDASGIGTPKTYRYDPAGNTWDDEAIADLPGAITDTVNGILNGRWILAGPGFAVAWDPGADTWTLLPFPLVRADHASGGSTGDAFYVVGGFDMSLYWHTWHAETQEYREAACPPTPTVTGTPPTATATPTTPPTVTATATNPPATTPPVTPPPASPSATLPPASPTATATPCGISFSDVQPTDYFAAAVHDLACRGVISGYADGTFRPYNLTSRAQMVKIVVLGFGYPIQTPAPDHATFADVPPAQPFWSVIETAAATGIVSGYDCGGPGEPCDAAHRPYFRPYSLVTRGQLAKIVVGGAGWPVLNPPGATFADVDPAHPFYAFVETAAAHGVISGYDCGSPGEPCDSAHRPYFRPANDATRGQIAKIVDLALPQAASPSHAAPGLPR